MTVSKAFNEVNRNRFKNIFNSYIVDKRFWFVINKLLLAGVQEDFRIFFEYKRVAQGSILSPFLFNLYMHELDKFIVGLQAEAAGTNKNYVSCSYGNVGADKDYTKILMDFSMDKWKVCIAKYGTVENVLKARRLAYQNYYDKYCKCKSVDSEIRHIQYVRYADNFLIGVVSCRGSTWYYILFIQDCLYFFIFYIIPLNPNLVVAGKLIIVFCKYIKRGFIFS